jgi:hypothetical protein
VVTIICALIQWVKGGERKGSGEIQMKGIWSGSKTVKFVAGSLLRSDRMKAC